MTADAQLHPDLPFGQFTPKGIAAIVLALCQHLPSAVPGARALNKLLRSPLKNGPVRQFDVTIKGLKLRLRTSGNYCELRQLFEPQFYDVEEIDWLCDELADGGCFVDIGGNIGLYSLHVGHRTGPATRVISVEPAPALAERMQFNARSNGIDIELATRALSDYSGIGTLNLAHRQSGENALDTENSGIPVSVTTLQQLCDEYDIQSIRAMKIDIEGHEDRVLGCFFDQAPQSLWPKSIVIEHTHDETRIVHRLKHEFGYALVARTRRNLLLRFNNLGARRT